MDWTWLYVVGGVVLNNIVLFFWKPWAQAYAGEKAKNIARKEDLDKILAEVRAVTAATEAIKADINGGLWERQMHWNQKRDLYAGALRLLIKLRQLYFVILNPPRKEDVDPASREVLEAETELVQYWALAQIFSNQEGVNALSEDMVSPLHMDSAEWAKKRVEQLHGVTAELILAAKKDLAIQQ
jgi:hypothetical protein